jgi:hypothetical protein
MRDMPLLVILTGGLRVRSGVFAENLYAVVGHLRTLPVHCERDKLTSATTQATPMIVAALR